MAEHLLAASARRQQWEDLYVGRWQDHGLAAEAMLDEVRNLSTDDDPVMAREVLGQAARSLLSAYHALGKSDSRVGSWYVSNYTGILIPAAFRALGERWAAPW